MDRLIREMSYLFTKQRFLELQETAKDIAIGHSDFDLPPRLDTTLS